MFPILYTSSTLVYDFTLNQYTMIKTCVDKNTTLILSNIAGLMYIVSVGMIVKITLNFSSLSKIINFTISLDFDYNYRNSKYICLKFLIILYLNFVTAIVAIDILFTLLTLLMALIVLESRHGCHVKLNSIILGVF